MSSGLAVASFAAWAIGGIPDAALPWFFAVAAAGMAVGLLFVFAEIGRRARFLYVLRRPQTSWMTRETYAVAVFYPAVAADLVWPSPAIHLVVTIAAAAFLHCQGRILHAGKGIPAWRHRLVPWMLVASGLFEGVALAAIGLVAFSLGGAFESASVAIPGSDSGEAGRLFTLVGLAGRRSAACRRDWRALPRVPPGRGDGRGGSALAPRPRCDRRQNALVGTPCPGRTLRRIRGRVPRRHTRGGFRDALPDGRGHLIGVHGSRFLRRDCDPGRSSRSRRRCGVRNRGGRALEVHAHHPRLPPAGVRHATRAATRLRHARRAGPVRARVMPERAVPFHSTQPSPPRRGGRCIASRPSSPGASRRIRHVEG